MHWKRLVPSSVRPEPQWSNVHRWRMQRWIHGVQVDTGLDTTLLCTLCPRSYDIRDGYMNFVSIYQKSIERNKNHTYQHHPPIAKIHSWIRKIRTHQTRTNCTHPHPGGNARWVYKWIHVVHPDGYRATRHNHQWRQSATPPEHDHHQSCIGTRGGWSV